MAAGLEEGLDEGYKHSMRSIVHTEWTSDVDTTDKSVERHVCF